MKRFAGLFRDTWFLWVGLILAGTILSIFVSLVFLVTFPISVFSFIYFALLRYDTQGNPREI
jgi:hypothetical protein